MEGLVTKAPWVSGLWGQEGVGTSSTGVPTWVSKVVKDVDHATTVEIWPSTAVHSPAIALTCLYAAAILSRLCFPISNSLAVQTMTSYTSARVAALQYWDGKG